MSTGRSAAIALLALAVTGVAATLVLLSDHDTSKVATIALAAPLGLGFIGAGIVAGRRRPENRTGLLMIATGFAWFVGALPEANDPLLFSIGNTLGAVFFGFLIHLILAFPSGRLGSRGVRVLAAAGYVVVATTNLAFMLVDDMRDACTGGCPENLFLVSREPGLANAVRAMTAVSAGVLAIAVVAVLARRWRAATPALRRALTPVFTAGGVTLLLAALLVVTQALDAAAADPVYWLLLASLTTVPLAFLAGLLRARLATAAVGRLLAETPETPTQEEAQQSLRRALRDPTLQLAFWLPERRAYVDAQGRPFTVPKDDARVSTPIVLDDEPLALVVHDAALSEEPELVSGVLAAAKLALQKDRLQAQLRAQVDELQRERDFVATVVNTAAAFFCVLDADGRIERFNTTLERVSGRVDDDAVRGRQFWDVFAAAGAAAEVRAAIEARAEGELEHEWRGADGGALVVGWHLTSLPGEKLLVSGVDVTARRRADENIRLHVQLLSDLADASPALLVVVNLDGRHNDDSMNQAARDAFGYEPAELDRRPFWDVWVPPEDRATAEAAIRAAVAGRPPEERESVWITKGGERRLVAWSCALMPDVGIRDRIVSINGIDVTERRRMLDEQAALRRVATLVAGDPDPDDLLQAVTREVGQLFGGDTATIFRYVDERHVTVMGGWSDSGERSMEPGSERFLDGDTAAVRVYRTQAPARVDDYRDIDGDFARSLREVGLLCTIAAPVIVAGALWGAISASSTHEHHFPPGAESRLGAFASLVAQAIANADARHELRRAAARIVEAGDAERRRLERNLHDGAQQRLVTLSLSLRLAQNRLHDDPDAARAILDNASVDLSLALEELRELARGLHPTILADRGLPAALTGLAARTAIPVEIDLMIDVRLPGSVEAALFYVAAEALTNVAKYAEAGSAHVRLALVDGVAVIEIEDDGVGGADLAGGSGLPGLRDRVESLDGKLLLRSEAGRGTLVRAEIPIAREDVPVGVA